MNTDLDLLAQKAAITRSGAVLLGQHTVCDGFEYDRQVAVFSHFHGDHLSGFERCLKNYDVLVSEATRDILIAQRGSALGDRENFISVPYEKPLDYSGEKITLYPATHVLGSAQALVEDKEGVRILYTGDFFLPNTIPIATDVLVMQATYGAPDRIRNFSQRDVCEQLISIVEQKLKLGPVCILAPRGILQEIMAGVFSAGITAPFLCNLEDFKIAKVYKKYGIDVGDCLLLGTLEAQEIIASKLIHIMFLPYGTDLHLLPEGIKYTKIAAIGWDPSQSVSWRTDDYCNVCLSGHADFNGLLEYVQASQAKVIVTDNHREGDAISLAEEIQKRLNVPAMFMPKQ